MGLKAPTLGDGPLTAIGYADVDARQTIVAVAAATPLPVTLAGAAGASENHIGEVGSPIAYIDVTLTPDTSILASGDVAADTQVVTNALRVVDGKGLIQSIVLVDDDDQGTAIDLIFLGTNTSVGTENSTPSIADANADTILGGVSFVAADFIDLGANRYATKTGVGLVVKAVSGTRDIYVAAICRSGTPTYTGSGIKLRIGILQG